MSQETHTFKAEIQQLLHILVHSLYTDREIFVRELISNAADALNRLKFEMLTQREVRDPDAELAIRIAVDEEAATQGRTTITISDSGIGMTRQELVENLGTIAQSGAAAFLNKLRAAAPGAGQDPQPSDAPALEMIGQFGVGFYSAFMAAQEVRVVSRSYQPDAEACEWVSDGSATFRVGPADKESRGTDVIVQLTEDAAEFASPWRLEQIVKKHSDFVAFPIYIGDRVVNRQNPLWRQSPHDLAQKEYNDFYKQLTMDFEDPLLTSHMVADVPVDIRSILYVPSRRDRGLLHARTDYGLRLYAKGVMIQEFNKDLLPQYLRFVEGVVESEDLPLNVSRETVQRNPAVHRIQKALVGKLLRELEELAKDEQAYGRFWQEFGIFLKEGIATDPATKDELLSLLRFHSSQEEQAGDRAAPHPLASLAAVKARMHDDQQAIYYLMGEDLDTIVHSPHLDYFRANDIEVLYLVDPIDSFMMMTLAEFEGVPLKNIDDASLELPTAQRPADAAGGEPQDRPDAQEGAEIPQEQFDRLIARFVQVLGDKVTQVRESKILRASPCRLVSPESTPGGDMQRVYRMLNQEYEVPKKILEINRGHVLIQNLARRAAEASAGSSGGAEIVDASILDTSILDAAIEQLYENQLLVEGLHPNPAAMIERIQALMEAATAGTTVGAAEDDAAQE